jgi:hypothetical protein
VQGQIFLPLFANVKEVGLFKIMKGPHAKKVLGSLLKSPARGGTGPRKSDSQSREAAGANIQLTE